MTCYNCNKEITDAAKYCQHCGAAQKPLTPPPGPQKLFRRSRKNKLIAGVCAGMADYFGVDLVLVRLIWVLVTFFSGIGFIPYFICWIVVPYAEEGAPAAAPSAPASPG